MALSKNDSDAGDRLEETLARKAGKKQTSLLGEYWTLLSEERKWWLAPILIVLLAIGAFVVLGGTSVAPFIYTLF